jgi:hypothetical protein
VITNWRQRCRQLSVPRCGSAIRQSVQRNEMR